MQSLSGYPGALRNLPVGVWFAHSEYSRCRSKESLGQITPTYSMYLHNYLHNYLSLIVTEGFALLWHNLTEYSSG